MTLVFGLLVAGVGFAQGASVQGSVLTETLIRSRWLLQM